MLEFDDSTKKYNLFISYAHADDRGEGLDKVKSLVQAIRADYLRVTGVPLNDFFDLQAIRAMDDWENRIILGLRQSKMMVALISPAYFKSPYCRKEWEYYIETELVHALPGEGIAPIYVIQHPDFEGEPIDDKLKDWIADLKKRQYVHYLDFWPHGAMALAEADAQSKINHITSLIVDRLGRAALLAANHHVPRPSEHFVGRREELARLRTLMIDSHIGAISTVNGIGGIGKSTLAFAYAWGYGFEYPGGRFLIEAANQTDLSGGMIALATAKGVSLTDEELRRTDFALNKVKTAFEAGPQALLVIDNLDDPALLGPQSLAKFLPKGDHIHVLVTTRAMPKNIPRVKCLPLDSLTSKDGQALLNQFQPIRESPQDDEWKAALEIVNRLAGHALAIEIVGVYLRSKEGTISYREFAETLKRDGISLIDDQVGPLIHEGQKWHKLSHLAQLLAPTLDPLRPEVKRALEYAALLPPDNIPLAWLRDLVQEDFPALPERGIGYTMTEVFATLESLRLLIPQPNPTSDETSPRTTPPAETRVARMHRLVQDVVLSRTGPEIEAERREAVNQHATARAEWMEAHWGQPNLVWELLALRDMALRMIDRGDQQGAYFGYGIGKPLEHIGRSIDARTIWTQSGELWTGLLESDPENESYLRELSASHSSLGRLAQSEGDGVGARRHFEAGLAIRERLARESPANAEYARELSLSHDDLGDLDRSKGNDVGARKHFEAALAIAERLVGESPANTEYARDLSISHNKLGEMARSEGDGVGARWHFEAALAIAERLARESPANAEYARDLSISHNKLGEMARSEGDGVGARRLFEAALAIRERLARESPGNADYARDLSISHDNLGDMARSEGNGVGARRHYEAGLAIRERLARESPANAQYARDLSISHNKLGEMARSEGDGVGARSHYEAGLAIRERLAGESPGNADYARDLSVGHDNLGDMARSEGDGVGARRHFEAALAIRERLARESPFNAEYARDLTISHNKLGDMARSEGNGVAARRHFEAALAIAERLARESPGNAEYARDLSVSHNKLGDMARSEGDDLGARRHYEAALAIRERLARESPGNAEYARDLAVSFTKFATLLQGGSNEEAMDWWRKAWEAFIGMKRRGMHLSPDDEEYVKYLEDRYGFGQ
jgi:tetratricopeptide (TPR) repeat protein